MFIKEIEIRNQPNFQNPEISQFLEYQIPENTKKN